MRILLTDREDNTLIVVEPTDVRYDPELSELYIYTANGDYYVVTEIDRFHADRALRELYDHDRVDLTVLKSYFDPGKEDSEARSD